METLDRLLMDRALGALPPDVEALLDAYLEHDAAGAARAREFGAAAMAARRLLQQPLPTPLPPFPATSIRDVARAQTRVRALGHVASMAAVLVVGIGLGLVFPHGRTLEAPGPRFTIVAPAPVITAEPAPGFWSTARLYASARRSSRTETAPVIWDSTTSLPRSGDQL
jgi:hypothetical protein